MEIEETGCILQSGLGREGEHVTSLLHQRSLLETSDTVCLASYRSPRGDNSDHDSTQIWQACRATSAAMIFFDPIAISPCDEEIR